MEYIQLQGIGKKQATQAENIKVGNTLIWNFGATARVTAIIKETEKQIVIEEQYTDGKIYQRRLNKNRLVAIA